MVKKAFFPLCHVVDDTGPLNCSVSRTILSHRSAHVIEPAEGCYIRCQSKVGPLPTYRFLYLDYNAGFIKIGNAGF